MQINIELMLIMYVVILSPSHFSGVSIFDGDAYPTPLGDVSMLVSSKRLGMNHL